jgi:tRNA threonylcarbamoyladenosine biosynthesis protein TsaB
MVQRLMQAHGISWSHISAIAFDQGPGAFTGIRVACGVAQGLAFGLACPVVPVSSLECLAEGARRQTSLGPGARVLAALDARMGELYVATLALHATGWQWEQDPRLITPADLMGAPPVFDVAVGDAFLRHSLPELSSRWCASAPQEPTAHALVTIALDRYSRGLACAPEKAELLYVRNKVALTSLERARAHG